MAPCKQFMKPKSAVSVHFKRAPAVVARAYGSVGEVGELKAPSEICEMCITKACEEPTSPGVWWRDDAEWKQYDAAMAAAIQKGLTNGLTRVELGALVSSKYARGAQYVVDLNSMKQINLASGFTRDVKVVKPPAAAVPAALVDASDDLARVTEEVRACEQSIRSLKETVEKLEADLLALKLQASKNEANRALAKVTYPIQVAPPSRVQPADYWESYDSLGEYYYDSLSDDDY